LLSARIHKSGPAPFQVAAHPFEWGEVARSKNCLAPL
jgi:hypothetical protein